MEPLKPNPGRAALARHLTRNPLPFRQSGNFAVPFKL